MNAKNTSRLIYSMGRVGTSSINKALNDANMNAFSGHWFKYGNTNGPAEYASRNLDLVDRIKEDKGKPLHVIVPIREPVARNIAAYFRYLQRKDVVTTEELKKYTIERLQNKMIKEYNIHYPDQWFNIELMDVFSFNPFKLEFNYDKGYSIYDVGRHRILIIRLENTGEYLSEALFDLVGVADIHMPHINKYEVSAREPHGEYGINLYNEFKKTPLPIDWVKKNYNLEYAQHFWTDEERAKLIERWTK